MPVKWEEYIFNAFLNNDVMIVYHYHSNKVIIERRIPVSLLLERIAKHKSSWVLLMLICTFIGEDDYIIDTLRNKYQQEGRSHESFVHEIETYDNGFLVKY